jgi:hypothetical protein
LLIKKIRLLKQQRVGLGVSRAWLQDSGEWHRKSRRLQTNRRNLRGSRMASVSFICPTHLKEVEAGIEIDDQTFRQTRLKIVRIRCPHCEREHRFLLADGHLAKDELTQASEEPSLAQ